MTLYTCQQRKNGNFIMSKLDDDMNVDGFYIMEKRGNAMTCSCASHKPYCKHMDVLVLMLERKAVGTGTFYDADNNTWYPPIVQEFVN